MCRAQFKAVFKKNIFKIEKTGCWGDGSALKSTYAPLEDLGLVPSTLMGACNHL